jgi:hypothetical protein
MTISSASIFALAVVRGDKDERSERQKEMAPDRFVSLPFHCNFIPSRNFNAILLFEVLSV